jgi:hypothetical protein
MELQLKHLANYLEHELMFFVDCNDGDTMTCKLEGLTDHEIYLDGFDTTYTDNDDYAKPILRPLSDLTKEIEHNGEKFVPLISIVEEIKGEEYEISKIKKHKDSVKFYVCNGLLGYYSNAFYDFDLKMIKCMGSVVNYEMQQKYLFGLHFDVFGLIDKGLAIDINTL